MTRHLRFSPEEYRALLRLSGAVALRGTSLTTLRRFLVAHLPVEQLDLARRIDRLDNRRMRTLHEHLVGQGPGGPDAGRAAGAHRRGVRSSRGRIGRVPLSRPVPAIPPSAPSRLSRGDLPGHSRQAGPSQPAAVRGAVRAGQEAGGGEPLSGEGDSGRHSEAAAEGTQVRTVPQQVGLNQKGL
jgi:hypothetical protein